MPVSVRTGGYRPPELLPGRGTRDRLHVAAQPELPNLSISSASAGQDSYTVRKASGEIAIIPRAHALGGKTIAPAPRRARPP